MKVSGQVLKSVGLALMLATSSFMVSAAPPAKKEQKAPAHPAKKPVIKQAAPAPAPAVAPAPAKPATPPADDKDVKLRKEQADKITALTDQVSTLTSQNNTLNAQTKADQARIDQLNKQVEQLQSQAQSGSLGFFTTLLFIIGMPAGLGFYFKREMAEIKKSLYGGSGKGEAVARTEPIFEDSKPHRSKKS